VLKTISKTFRALEVGSFDLTSCSVLSASLPRCQACLTAACQGGLAGQWSRYCGATTEQSLHISSAVSAAGHEEGSFTPWDLFSMTQLGLLSVGTRRGSAPLETREVEDEISGHSDAFCLGESSSLCRLCPGLSSAKTVPLEDLEGSL
jgi:hypothetical protein